MLACHLLSVILKGADRASCGSWGALDRARGNVWQTAGASKLRYRSIIFSLESKNKMPRKSRTELALIPHLRDHHRRISPPDGLSPKEAALFRQIVDSARDALLSKRCAFAEKLLPSRHSLFVGIRSRDGKPRTRSKIGSYAQRRLLRWCERPVKHGSLLANEFDSR